MRFCFLAARVQVKMLEAHRDTLLLEARFQFEQVAPLHDSVHIRKRKLLIPEKSHQPAMEGFKGNSHFLFGYLCICRDIRTS